MVLVGLVAALKLVLENFSYHRFSSAHCAQVGYKYCQLINAHPSLIKPILWIAYCFILDWLLSCWFLNEELKRTGRGLIRESPLNNRMAIFVCNAYFLNATNSKFFCCKKKKKLTWGKGILKKETWKLFKFSIESYHLHTNKPFFRGNVLQWIGCNYFLEVKEHIIDYRCWKKQLKTKNSELFYQETARKISYSALQ